MFGLYSMLFINFNSSSSQYGVWIPIKNTIVKSGTVILENSNIILDLTSGNIFVINFTQDSTIEILNLDDVLADNNSYVANLKLTNLFYNVIILSYYLRRSVYEHLARHIS